MARSPRPSPPPRATRKPPTPRSRWCYCRRPAPRSTSTRISSCAERRSSTRFCLLRALPPSRRHPEVAAIRAFTRVFDALWRPSKDGGRERGAVALRGSLRSLLRVTDRDPRRSPLILPQPCRVSLGADGEAMVSRTQRTPFGDWWWTVDKLTLAAIGALMLAGVVLSLAASPPVAGRLGLDPFYFVNR